MRNRYLLVLDLPLIAFCVFLAFALRFDLLFIQNDNIRWLVRLVVVSRRCS